MAKHGVFESQRMQSEYDASKLRSIKFEKDYDNGLVFALDGLADGESEAYKVKDATGTDTVEKGLLVILSTPEVDNVVGWSLPEDFYNRKGTIGRGTVLCVGDVFGVSAECITGAPKAKQYVKATSGGKLTVNSAATGAIGQILDQRNGIWGIQVIPTTA